MLSWCRRRRSRWRTARRRSRPGRAASRRGRRSPPAGRSRRRGSRARRSARRSGADPWGQRIQRDRLGDHPRLLTCVHGHTPYRAREALGRGTRPFDLDLTPGLARSWADNEATPPGHDARVGATTSTPLRPRCAPHSGHDASAQATTRRATTPRPVRPRSATGGGGPPIAADAGHQQQATDSDHQAGREPVIGNEPSSPP